MRSCTAPSGAVFPTTTGVQGRYHSLDTPECPAHPWSPEFAMLVSSAAACIAYVAVIDCSQSCPHRLLLTSAGEPCELSEPGASSASPHERDQGGEDNVLPFDSCVPIDGRHRRSRISIKVRVVCAGIFSDKIVVHSVGCIGIYELE